MLVKNIVLKHCQLTLQFGRACIGFGFGGGKDKHPCRVTIRSPSPKDLGYEPNEPNTMNLQKVGERAGLLANGLTASKDLKNEQTQKNTNKA